MVTVAKFLVKKHLSFPSDRTQVVPSTGSDNFSLTVNFSF